jgi:hypothetical protein
MEEVLTCGQYDFLSELQVHLPDQGIGHVCEALWRREDSMKDTHTLNTRVARPSKITVINNETASRKAQ